MKKFSLYLGAVLGSMIFLYAALSALVKQGLSIWGAVIMLIVIILGGIGLLVAVRK